MIGPGGGPEVGGGGPAVAPAVPAAAVKGLEAKVPQARAEAAQRDDAAREEATPKEDPESKIAAKVRENDDFKRLWGDYYNAAKTNSPDGKVDPAKIDKLASDSYYSDLAEKQQTQGIPKEISDDPKFLKEMGKAVSDAQKEGKPLDMAELQKRALADYYKQKDLQEEVKAGEAPEGQERIKDLENKVSELTTSNENLKAEISQVMAALIPALVEVLRIQRAKEPDPEKQEALAELIAKILALAALSIVGEAAKAIVPPSR